MPTPELTFGNSYLIYDPATGAPQYTVDFPANPELVALLEAEGRAVVVIPAQSSLMDSYVSEGVFTLRPQNPTVWREGKYRVLANRRDNCFLDNIPEGASLTVDGVPFYFSGTSVEFGADTPGVYRIEVKLWPYLEWRAIFVAE